MLHLRGQGSLVELGIGRWVDGCCWCCLGSRCVGLRRHFRYDGWDDDVCMRMCICMYVERSENRFDR